ncbi:uncharacterized protein JCM10292_003567 [Rhodotorula paludigena]|uniref:uncharacterized protein n=1 Tax=Rhodotorula paludigena TaxID=86838 RepID=UPI0031792F82
MDPYSSATPVPAAYPAYPQRQPTQPYPHPAQREPHSPHYASYPAARAPPSTAPPPPPLGAAPSHLHTRPEPAQPAYDTYASSYTAQQQHYLQPRSRPRPPAQAAEPEWRESSWIGQYGSFSASSPDGPASPVRQSGLYAAQGGASTSAQPAYPAYSSAAAAQPEYARHVPRPSDESSHYSIYSYHSDQSSGAAAGPSKRRPPPPPPLVPPSHSHAHASLASTASTASVPASLAMNGSGHLPQRQQSLEHLRAAKPQTGTTPYDWRSQLEALSIAEEEYNRQQQQQHQPEYSSVQVASPLNSPALPPDRSSASPPPAPTAPPPRPPPLRQPTILMSPPLEGPPAALGRNRSIDSTWSRALTSPSQSHSPSFAPGASSSSSSPDVSRRPSYATLSPNTSLHASSSSHYLRADSYDAFSFLDAAPPSSPSAVSSSLHGHAALLGGSGGAGPASRSDRATEWLVPALLSHLAVYLADHVPRSARTKPATGTSHPACFTGSDAVSTLARVLPRTGGQQDGAEDRALALRVARELQQALWFYELDWDPALLQDDDEPSSFLAAAEFHSQLFALSRASGEEATTALFELDEVPTGVVTALTPCYSPFCAQFTADGFKQGACYSASCPNRRAREPSALRGEAADGALHRVPSALSQTPAAAAAAGVSGSGEQGEYWATSVPSAVLESLDKRQTEYQNLVYELIKGEQQFCDDLEYLETEFVDVLRNASPPIILPSRLPHFLSSILPNLTPFLARLRTSLAALRAKQHEAYVVRAIGAVLLPHLIDLGPEYDAHAVRYEMARFLVKEEQEANPRFNELIESFHRRPGANRQSFEHFHSRITLRFAKYPLLLENILAKADDDDADREYVAQASDFVKQLLEDTNARMRLAAEKVALREWNRDLYKKGGEPLDLELLDESRKFFKADRVVYRRPEGSGFSDQLQDAHLVLFDNYLILTKPPRSSDRDTSSSRAKYQLVRRPVPLDLVQLKTNSFSEPPLPRSSGFHLRSNRSAGPTGASANGGAPLVPSPSFNGAPLGASPGSGADSLLYPISFFQLGRFDGLVHLYVDSAAARAEWERQLKAAVSLRQQRQEAQRVVRLDPLADQTFGTTTGMIGSLAAGSAPQHQGTLFSKPTCSTPLRTADGLWLVIAGCAEGIFIGWRGKPRTMQQVVHLAGITQCAVLPEFSFLLVIANKVLVAYALEALIPSKTGSKLDQASKAPQRLSGQKDVSFFKVGKIGDADPRTLVIYAKKSGVKESVFKALEPVSQAERTRTGGGAGHRFLGLGGGRPEWFRTYKEFFMPSLVTGLHFQRSKLALIGSRGVEIMDLESMRTMTVPDFPSVRNDRALYVLAKRCEDASTMGMFRIGDSKFLLAYSEFAIHVGRHGEPIEGPFIEWESKPETIAYCAPYVFAISPNIIEIRNAFNGRLSQVITGSHISLTYDGTAIPTSPASSSSSTFDLRMRRPSSHSTGGGVGAEDLAGPPERRLHLSMRQGMYHVLYEVVVIA